MEPYAIPPHECWVCGKPVSLEECKIDEQGRAVHEQCYLTRMKQDSSSQTGANQSFANET
jgi:hypothetical protein